MAHSLSAKKRVRQSAKRRMRNRARKSIVKTQMKKFEDALKEGNLETANQQFRLVQKQLDKVAASSTMHKNTAARIKSRMNRRLKALKEKKA